MLFPILLSPLSRAQEPQLLRPEHPRACALQRENKGLDLIDRVPDELWTEVHDIVQETGFKNIPKKKKCKKRAFPPHLRMMLLSRGNSR